MGTDLCFFMATKCINMSEEHYKIPSHDFMCISWRYKVLRPVDRPLIHSSTILPSLPKRSENPIEKSVRLNLVKKFIGKVNLKDSFTFFQLCSRVKCFSYNIRRMKIIVGKLGKLYFIRDMHLIYHKHFFVLPLMAFLKHKSYAIPLAREISIMINILLFVPFLIILFCSFPSVDDTHVFIKAYAYKH